MTARRLLPRTPAPFALGALCVLTWSYAWASQPDPVPASTPIEVVKVQPVSCTTTAQGIEGPSGTEATVDCPPQCGGQTVWGTGLYTDDSSVCSAAMHAGELDRRGGQVTIRIAPGAPKYAASDWHGVRTSAWGEWGRSFQIVARSGVPGSAVPAEPHLISCEDTAVEFGSSGSVREVACPSGCAPAPVWGDQLYTDDSSICSAARHAGVIGPRGGKFEVVMAPGKTRYGASLRNGVASRQWGEWRASYSVRP